MPSNAHFGSVGGAGANGLAEPPGWAGAGLNTMRLSSIASFRLVLSSNGAAISEPLLQPGGELATIPVLHHAARQLKAIRMRADGFRKVGARATEARLLQLHPQGDRTLRN